MAMRYSSGNPTLDMLMGGLGNRESSMNFRAVGPATRNGDRAYGFSQVMGSNIGPWTQEVLGVRMSPQQYLNNSDAQFAVTSAKLGGYLSKYGNPEDALSMWHSGRPMARSGKANDGFVNTHDYVKQIMAGQDPRSFVASATPQATGEAPMQLPGANLAGGAQGSPQATVGPQSVSLGDDQQQPFDNIGSTLANVGAAIASLDSQGTGIASLNASRVAQNLSAQEAMRERQGGWKFVRQTDNGLGMIFQNSKGEVRVEPLAPGFAGQKESSTTAFLKEIQANPELGDVYRKIHGVQDQEEYDPESLKLAGMDWLSNGNPQALKDVPIKKRPEAMRLAREQFKADTGQDYDPADLAIRRGDYKILQSESAKFGQMLAPTQAAHDRLQADIKIAKERIADLPAELNSSNLPWNKFMQMTAEQLQTQGFGKLAKAREAIYNVERGYTNVQSNGMRTGDTVTAQKRAEGLINSAMTPDALLGEVGEDGRRSGGLLDFMSDSGTRILNSVKGGQDTLRQEWKNRAKNFGSGIKKTEDEITSEIEKRLGGSSGSQPSKLTNAPSEAHVQALRQHPEMRDQFDAKFGAGAAARILGN